MILLRLARTVSSASGRCATQLPARRCHRGAASAPDFHEKFGFAMLGSGAVFAGAVWFYVCTQTGIAWNLSPVGKVTPKEWRQ